MRKALMVAMLALVGCSSGSKRAQEHDTRLLKDRLWIDHMPTHDRDKLNVFVALTQRPRQGPPGPIGIFEEVSAWEGHFEAFRYENDGEEMRVFFPQSGDRETLTVKPSKCTVDGMDYCLDVTGSKRGVAHYYSRRGWEVRTTGEAAALATQLAK